MTKQAKRKAARRAKRRRVKLAAELQAAAPRGTLTSAAADVEWLEAAEGDDQAGERVPRFRMVAYTGGIMHPRYMGPTVVDLAGLAVRPTRPVLRDHDTDRIVGHTTRVEMPRGRRLVAEGEISGSGDDAAEITATSGRGFPWQASVGARILEAERVHENESATVNGRRLRGPFYLIRRAELTEISFVAIGGDGNTAATVAADAEEGALMGFEAWLAANGWNADDLSDTQLMQLRAAYEADLAASSGDGGDGEATADDGDAGREPAGVAAAGQAAGQPARRASGVPAVGYDPSADRAAAAAERNRQVAIRQLCAQYGEPTVRVTENGDARRVDLAAHAIENGWDATRTELEAMRESRGRSQGPRPSGGDQARHFEALECAMALRVGGLSEEAAGRDYGEQVVNAALGREYRTAGLHRLLHAVCQAAGVHVTAGAESDEDFIRAAFGASQSLQASGLSTISLPGVLGNLANKTLLAAYRSIAVRWADICAVESNSDFKSHTRYQLTAGGAFMEVGPTGELAHTELTESTYTSQLGTHGRIITLNRQMIANDDLGAFTRLVQLMGRQAALALEAAVFKLVLSGVTNSFFAAGNANYLTGAGTALSIASLTNAATALANQVDADGQPVLSLPDRILVPTTLETTARELYDETKIEIEGSNTGTGVRPARNPHVGRYMPIASPYLNNTAIRDADGVALTGQLDTHWGILANPNDLAAFEVAFLNGRREPIIESGDLSFNTLGMGWRGYYDFGVAYRDPRAIQWMKGAA